jgi:hypothetical protein
VWLKKIQSRYSNRIVNGIPSKFSTTNHNEFKGGKYIFLKADKDEIFQKTRLF